MAKPKGKEKGSAKPKRRQYSESDRNQAIKLWIANQDYNKTAEETSVPPQTIRSWIKRYYEPNPEQYEEIRKEALQEVKDTLAEVDIRGILLKNVEIMQLAQKHIIEELQKGEYANDRLLRSYNAICGTATDKYLALLNQAMDTEADEEVIIQVNALQIPPPIKDEHEK